MVPPPSWAGLALMPSGGRPELAPHRDKVMSRQGAAHRDNRAGRLSLFAVREFPYRRAVVAGRLPNPSVRGFDSFRRCVSTIIDNSTVEQVLRGRGELGGHAGLPNRSSGFDAHRPLFASQAQPEEHPPRKREVSGSRPEGGSRYEVEHGGLCGALIRRWIRFNSWHLDVRPGSLAQLVEQSAE